MNVQKRAVRIGKLFNSQVTVFEWKVDLFE